MRKLQYMGGDPDIIAFPIDEVSEPSRQHFRAAVLDMVEYGDKLKADARNGNVADFLTTCVEMQMRGPQMMAQVMQSYFMGMAGMMGMAAQAYTPPRFEN